MKPLVAVINLFSVLSLLVHVAAPAITGAPIDPFYAWLAALWIVVFGLLATFEMWDTL